MGYIIHDPVIPAILALIVGIFVGIGIMKVAGKHGLDRAITKSQDILEEANSKAETITRQATLDAKQQTYELKLQAEKEIKNQQNKLLQVENKTHAPAG